MPKTPGQPAFRTLVAAAKKAIKTGALSQAKDLLNSAIDPKSQAVDHLKARYIRATVMFAIGDYGAAQADERVLSKQSHQQPSGKV